MLVEMPLSIYDISFIDKCLEEQMTLYINYGILELIQKLTQLNLIWHDYNSRQ